MRTGTSALLICCCALTGFAREEYKRDFQKTLSLPVGRSLRVDHSNGSVNIRTAAKNEVAIQADIRCSADTAAEARSFAEQIQVRVEESGSGIVVRTEYPKTWTRRNISYSVNYEITMPETAPLELRNRFGAVTVQNLHAAGAIHNANGNVTFLSGRGRQRIDNAFGNVEVAANDGDVTVVSANGWVRASDITGTVEITGRFGDVRVSNAGQGLTVHGGNGKVDVEHVAGLATITNSFGDVRVWDAKSDLAVQNQNGKVDANRVAGKAELHTTFAPVKFSGIGKTLAVRAQNSSITGDTVGESATVETTFGSVDLRGVKGGARVTAGNSAIRLTDISGEVYARTTFAGTTIEGAAGPVTVESGNGSVTVASRPGAPCKPILLRTTFAPIRVTVPGNVGYTLSGKTSFGRIHSEHEMSVSGAIGADAITGKIAGGGCEMRLNNQNGNIDILKR